jgi:GR25 family glycosyltransferase involved in LPS biosynthesis
LFFYNQKNAVPFFYLALTTKKMSELPIYAISIRPVRLRAFTDRVRPLEFTIVDGVNGEKLSHRLMEEDRIYKALPYLTLSRGTIGCYLSHRSVWEKISTGPDDYALILEDDADFAASQVTAVQQAVEEISQFDKLWTVIILGQQRKLAARNSKAPKGYYVPAQCSGLHIYLVSKRGAAQLLTGALPIHDPVDTYVTSVPLKGRYASVKDLCGTLNFGSDVDNIC